MSKRMMNLLAALLAVALALAFDRPPRLDVVELAPRKERRAQVALAPAPAQVDADGPIPDLFAGAANDGAGSLAQSDSKVAVDGAGAGPVFSLLGFKVEDGVREAYLLRDGAVLVARAGAVLEKRYRVQAVRADAVHITDIRSGASLRIGYGEEQ